MLYIKMYEYGLVNQLSVEGVMKDLVPYDLLERVMALIDRYGAERLLVAIAIGVSVQILALLVLRVLGAALGIIARFFTWFLAVTVALYALDANRDSQYGDWVSRSYDVVLRWLTSAIQSVT